MVNDDDWRARSPDASLIGTAVEYLVAIAAAARAWPRLRNGQFDGANGSSRHSTLTTPPGSGATVGAPLIRRDIGSHPGDSLGGR
jgi:hypothetical protein